MKTDAINKTLENAFIAITGCPRPAFNPDTCAMALGRELYRRMPDYARPSPEVMNVIRCVGTPSCPLSCPNCRLKSLPNSELPAMLPH